VHRPRRRLAVAASLAGLLLATLLPLAGSPAGAQDTGNPDLTASCGVDITLIIDRSNSISTTEATDIRDAARALIRGLVGTGSRVQVIVFGTHSHAVLRSATGSYATSTNIADLQYYSAAELQDLPAFPPAGDGEGGTNWDDALEMARRAASISPLTVFLTDGDPTYHLTTAPDGHGGTVGGTGSSTGATDLSRAQQEAGYLRSGAHPAGARTRTHLFGVGVGLTSSTSEDRMRSVTGPDELTLGAGGQVLVNGAPGEFAVADYVIVPNFADLEFAFIRFVWSLCAQVFSLEAMLQQGDGTEVPTPITFSITTNPVPRVWTEPSTATGATAAATAGADGRASFAWSPTPTSTGATELTVTASGLPQGYTFNGVQCTGDNPDDPAPAVVLLDTKGPNQAGSNRGEPTWAIPGGLNIHLDGTCKVFFRQLRGDLVTTQRVVITATAPSPRDGRPVTATAVVELDDDDARTFRVISWRTE
jgi:hypothetical protein